MSNTKKNYAVLPGFDGVPFRMPKGAEVPQLKSTDRVQPVEVWDAHVKIFNLSIETDLKEYTEIIDKIAKGKALFSAEERQWDPKKRTFIVFLRWLDRFMQMPEGRTIENGQSTSYTS